MSASPRQSFVLGLMSGMAGLAVVLAMLLAGAAPSASSGEPEGTESPSASPSPSETATTQPAAPSAGGDLINDVDLSVDAALAAAQGALLACREEGFNVSVAVVNRDDGLIKAHLRGDNTGVQTVESSRRKAYTAAGLGRPTDELAERAFSGDPQTRALPDLSDDVLFLGGGLPILAQGNVIAGIGVGGAPGVERDKVCAQAGIDAIADVLS